MSVRMLRVRASVNFKRYRRGDELLLVEDADVIADVTSRYWEVLAIEQAGPPDPTPDAPVEDESPPEAVQSAPVKRRASSKGKTRAKAEKSV